MSSQAPTAAPFESFAQNGEDVVLWRALGQIAAGRYIDIGANHPAEDSVSRAFYDHGWVGITVEPVPYFADLLRRERPADTVIEAAVTSRPGGSLILHEVPGTGLSTALDDIRDRHRDHGYEIRELRVAARRLDDILEAAGWAGQEIHFLSVDTEGSESEVLASVDLTRWRPWVIVVESTAPNDTAPTHGEWEAAVLAAGYRFRLFDGLSRFYVAAEHDDEIGARLAAPANVHDNFTTLPQRRLIAQLAARREELAELGSMHHHLSGEHHRLSEAHHDLTEQHRHLTEEHQGLSQEHHRLNEEHDRLNLELRQLQQELAAMRGSLAWRLLRRAGVVDRHARRAERES
jgi:FkbM family methyltransferase